MSEYFKAGDIVRDVNAPNDATTEQGWLTWRVDMVHGAGSTCPLYDVTLIDGREGTDEETKFHDVVLRWYKKVGPTEPGALVRLALEGKASRLAAHVSEISDDLLAALAAYDRLPIEIDEQATPERRVLDSLVAILRTEG